ncbi:protein GVQW3-like, partial [Aphis craccivora]
RPEKWRSGTWFLHHDNAPAHSALSIREFLAEKKYLIKSALKGQRFQDVVKIKANTATELKAITLEQFQRTFKKWQDRWNHCISSGGEYFEGDIFK